MKTVSVRELQRRIRECVETAQKDQVVITRRGQPAAVLIGVEGLDWESVVLGTDAAFWAMIQARRKEPTISRDELMRRLADSDETRKSRPRKVPTRK